LRGAASLTNSILRDRDVDRDSDGGKEPDTDAQAAVIAAGAFFVQEASAVGDGDKNTPINHAVEEPGSADAEIFGTVGVKWIGCAGAAESADHPTAANGDGGGGVHAVIDTARGVGRGL